MDRVKRSSIGQFFARVKQGQLENFLSYCVNDCIYAGLNEPIGI